MNKLISVNFTRLKKSKIFWIGLIGMFAYGVGNSVFCYFRGQQVGYDTVILNEVFFGHGNIIGFIAAAFCSVFLSTEYREGAIRNKLIVGNTRTSVYLSNLIVNSIAMLVINLSYMLAICIIGIPLLGNIVDIEMIVVLKLFGLNILATLSFTAFFTLIGMIQENSVIATIIGISIALVLFFVSPFINEQLLEPKVLASFSYSEETNEEIITSQRPNPYYVGGAKRSFYDFLADFLPSGHFVQINKEMEIGTEEEMAPEISSGLVDIKIPNYTKMSLYELLLIAVTTGIGVFIFGKKDLK